MPYTKEAPGQGRAKSAHARKPVLVRVPDDILCRIDEVARRLGLSRSGLMLLATVEKLETMR